MRLDRTFECDGVIEELPDGDEELCGYLATCWDPETELCYCDDHEEGLVGLRPISEMPHEAVQRIQARQRTEG